MEIKEWDVSEHSSTSWAVTLAMSSMRYGRYIGVFVYSSPSGCFKSTMVQKHDGRRGEEARTPEGIKAAVNAFIQFPDLEMRSQYAQEISSFPETRHQGPIHQSA